MIMAVDSLTSDMGSLDELINEVAKHIGKEWKSLAHVMEFSQTDIDAIEYDNSHNLKEQIHQLFHQWKQRESTNATPMLLLEAINKANLQDVITKLYSNDSTCDPIPIDRAMHLVPKPRPKHLYNSLGSTKHNRAAKPINIRHYHIHHINLLLVKRKIICPQTKTSPNNPEPELYDLVQKKHQSHNKYSAQHRQDSNDSLAIQWTVKGTKMCERDVYCTPETGSIRNNKPEIGCRRLFAKAINSIKKETLANTPLQPDHTNVGKFRTGTQKITFSFPDQYAGIFRGKNGDNVRDIKRDTCTSIKLNLSGNRMEVCITGREENCSKALVQILTHVEHFLPHVTTLKLSGVSRGHRYDIERLSGAKIISCITERGLCKIKGTTGQIDDAKQLIERTVTMTLSESTPKEKLLARCKKIGFEF